MIRRALTTSLVALALALALPSQSNGQALVALSAGLTVPIGDFGDVASAGWAGRAAVVFPVGENGLFAGGEAGYGQNSFDDDVTTITDDKWKIFTALAALGWMFQSEDSSVTPFIWAGGGLLSAKVGDGDSNSEFLLATGGGVTFGQSSTKPYLEARLMTASSDGFDIQFFEVAAGVTIAVGG